MGKGAAADVEHDAIKIGVQGSGRAAKNMPLTDPNVANPARVVEGLSGVGFTLLVDHHAVSALLCRPPQLGQPKELILDHLHLYE